MHPFQIPENIKCLYSRCDIQFVDQEFGSVMCSPSCHQGRQPTNDKRIVIPTDFSFRFKYGSEGSFNFENSTGFWDLIEKSNQLEAEKLRMEKRYSLRVISPGDTPQVIDFLCRFFFRDEPLNIETGMDLDYINGKRCPELEAYCTNSIPEGNSVMAVSDAEQLVGVCLNGGVRRNDSYDGRECPNDKFKKVLNLLIATGKQADIFNKYPKLNSFLDVKIISVDIDWRGMGICKALISKTREVAKEQHFQLVKVDCTSHITALAVERLGFEKIHVLKYDEHFEDDRDKPVFNPPPPHVGVEVYVLKLDDI